MSIVSGYKKFKKYILTSSGFQLVSHWTNANTLQFDDGKTAQAKLGTIDGISSSKDSSSEKIAASTKLVSELNSNFSGQFGGMTFWVNDTGEPCVTYKVGADSVSKKLGSWKRILIGSNNTSIDCKKYEGWADFTLDNFFIVAARVRAGVSWSLRYGNINISAIPSLTYNKSTGILSISNTSANESHTYDEQSRISLSTSLDYDIYLITMG